MKDFRLPDYTKLNLNIGMIGCGNISRSHADVLESLGVNIQAVSATPNSKNIGSFVKEYSVKHSYKNWNEMIEQEKLDAVWVVASWDVIDEMLLPILEYKIPVFFEKPVALSHEKIEAAIDMHKDMIERVQVGYNRRFYDFIPSIKEILKTVSVKGIEIHIPEGTSGIKNIKLLNNLFLQNSSHVLDLLCYLLDSSEIKIDLIIRHTNPVDGTPMGYNGFLLVDNSIPVHLIASWDSPANFGLKFHSANILVELLPLETAVIYEGFDIIEPTKDNPIRRYKPKIKEQFFIDPLSAKFKPGFLKQTINFIETCILGNYKNTQASNLSSAMEITRSCRQIMKG